MIVSPNFTFKDIPTQSIINAGGKVNQMRVRRTVSVVNFDHFIEIDLSSVVEHYVQNQLIGFEL